VYLILQEYGSLIDAALEYYDAVGGEEASELSLRADDAPVNMYEDINPELIGGELAGWKLQLICLKAHAVGQQE
jgi:hypothetical protein